MRFFFCFWAMKGRIASMVSISPLVFYRWIQVVCSQAMHIIDLRRSSTSSSCMWKNTPLLWSFCSSHCTSWGKETFGIHHSEVKNVTVWLYSSLLLRLMAGKKFSPLHRLLGGKVFRTDQQLWGIDNFATLLLGGCKFFHFCIAIGERTLLDAIWRSRM